MNRVYDILGITEFDLANVEDRSKFYQNNEFVNIQNGQTTHIGIFTTPSIAELKSLIDFNELISKPDLDLNPVKITVQSGIDIGQLQGTLKTTDKAMIQVASNFNCLEVANRKHNPNNGRLIEDHVHDNTQGPAATFGTLAASLYRCHFVFNQDGKICGQTLNRQLNMLHDVDEYFGTPINGKLTLTGNHKVIPNEFTIVADKIKVGLHTDCAIMYDRNGKLSEPYQMVDQVFNSTINLRNYGQPFLPYNRSNDEKFMSQVLLRAAYEGVYLSAIIREREVLYLTLIGGGVFKNKIPLIIDELERAHNKYAKYSKLKQVILCLYQPDNYIINYFK